MGNEFYNGKEVEFRCPKDYVLEPKNSKKLICENGRWNGTFPLCKGSVDEFFYFKNSKLRNKANYSQTKQALGSIT